MQTNGEERATKRQRTETVELTNNASPTNPPLGSVALYARDGLVYTRDETGAEVNVATGVGGSTASYGEMVGVGVAVSMPLQDVWTKVTGLSAGLTTGFTVVSDALQYTSTASGPFLVAVSCSFENDVKNSNYEVSVFVNGIEQSDIGMSRRIANNDVGSASLSGIVALANGDFVDLRVQCLNNDASTVTFVDLNMSVAGIGGGGAGGGGGTGDVVGPGGATDNAIARYNLGTGKIIKDSIVNVTDAGDLVWTAPANPTLTCGAGSIVTLDAEQINLTPQLDVSGGGGVRVNSGMIVNTTTGALRLPTLTTVQRDAIALPSAGDTIYNTTTGTEEVYNGSAWTQKVAGPASVTDGAMCVYDGTSGKLVKETSWLVTDGTLSSSEAQMLIANPTGRIWHSAGDGSITLSSSGTGASLFWVAPEVKIQQSLFSTDGYTMPVVRGTNGQVLQTNGSGVVTWQTPSGGGGSTVPTQGTLIRDTPYDPVDVDDAVTFEFTVGNQPVGIGTITSDLFSCSTGNVTITDVTGVSVDTDLLNRVFTIEAQFDTAGTQTLSFDNTASAKVRNALGDAFLACTADVDVVVNAITLSTDLYTLVMSSNTAPSPWVAQASTNDSGATGAWEAFANAISTDSWISNLAYANNGSYTLIPANTINGVTGEWVCLTNSLGNFYNPTTYSLAGRSNAGGSIVLPARTWTIFATTDYTSAVESVTTWVLLDSQVNVTLLPDYSAPVSYTIPPANRFPWRRVVIVVQELHVGGALGGHKAGIREWTFDDA